MNRNFDPKLIATKDLKRSDIPIIPRQWLPTDNDGREDWSFINFALSFDGYDFLGDELGELANTTERLFESKPQILRMFNTTGLRALLFFAQRLAKWNDEFNVSEFARCVAEAIRDRLTA